MENLIKDKVSKGFFKYPSLSFDAQSGACKIAGESFMEDSREFYSDIFNWLKEYNETQSYKPIKLEIRLIYFNTSSSKMLFEMLNQLQTYNSNGQEIKIEWYYEPSDSELYDDIMDMCYDTDIDIDVIPE